MPQFIIGLTVIIMFSLLNRLLKLPNKSMIQSGKPFYAEIKKRIGNITSEDFCHFAERMLIVCGARYNQSKIEVVTDKRSHDSSYTVIIDPNIEDINDLIEKNFFLKDELSDIYSDDRNLTVVISPLKISDDYVIYSMIKLEWRMDNPKKIIIFTDEQRYRTDDINSLEKSTINKLREACSGWKFNLKKTTLG